MAGIDIIDDRAAENRDVLERIRAGRQHLRRLPGGLARGGGERWFEEVIPSAAGHTCSKPCSPTSNPKVPPEFLEQSHRSGSVADAAANAANAAADADAATTTTVVEDIFAEFEPRAYKPFYGPGGSRQNETYEQAQARLNRLTEQKLEDVRAQWPQVLR